MFLLLYYYDIIIFLLITFFLKIKVTKKNKNISGREGGSAYRADNAAKHPLHTKSAPDDHTQ